jgi:hypothetical protein
LSNIIFLLFFNMPAGHETIIDAFDFWKLALMVSNDKSRLVFEN